MQLVDTGIKTVILEIALAVIIILINCLVEWRWKTVILGILGQIIPQPHPTIAPASFKKNGGWFGQI